MFGEREVFEILKRKPGYPVKSGEKAGWMALVKGFGSPNGLHNFWFTQWAKDTFSGTKRQAELIFRKKWEGWKLVSVRPVKLVKKKIGKTEPFNLDTMIELDKLSSVEQS